MKNLNQKLASGILIAVLFGTSALTAQERQQRQRGPEGRHQAKEMSERRKPQIPDLTEEQEAQMKEFKVQHDKESLPIKNQLNEAEAKLQTLITADEINKNEVGRVIDGIADLKAELMKIRVDHMEEVKSILTEEQKVFMNNQLANKPGRRPARRR